MTARVIDGVALAATIRQDVAMRSAALKAQGTQPGLAVILANWSASAWVLATRASAIRLAWRSRRPAFQVS